MSKELNFKDETIWRGLVLARTFALRGMLTELGAWLAALVIAVQLDPYWPRFHLVVCVAAVMLVRMISAHYDDWKKLRSVEREIRATSPAALDFPLDVSTKSVANQ